MNIEIKLINGDTIEVTDINLNLKEFDFKGRNFHMKTNNPKSETCEQIINPRHILYIKEV